MRREVIAGGTARARPSQAIRRALWSTEYMALAMLLLYTTLALIFAAQIEAAFGIVQTNVLIGLAVMTFALWYDQTGSRLAHACRSFYVAPLGLVLYSQIQEFIPFVNSRVYDQTLAAWDRALLGVNPTEWAYQFAHPALTEYLQLSYGLFQIIMIVPAVSAYRSQRHAEFRKYTSIMIFGFFMSYLLYFVMPAIGPRFELHDFALLDAELPGLLLTPFLRDVVNIANNIVAGADDPSLVASRDCMPSGHTMMSVLGILMSWHLRLRWRWLVSIGGISVIMATVYLRYHYVVDLIVGAALAVIVFLTHRHLLRGWQRLGIEV